MFCAKFWIVMIGAIVPHNDMKSTQIKTGPEDGKKQCLHNQDEALGCSLTEDFSAVMTINQFVYGPVRWCSG